MEDIISIFHKKKVLELYGNEILKSISKTLASLGENIEKQIDVKKQKNIEKCQMIANTQKFVQIKVFEDSPEKRCSCWSRKGASDVDTPKAVSLNSRLRMRLVCVSIFAAHPSPTDVLDPERDRERRKVQSQK
jgi:hypothetical protein